MWRHSDASLMLQYNTFNRWLQVSMVYMPSQINLFYHDYGHSWVFVRKCFFSSSLFGLLCQVKESVWTCKSREPRAFLILIHLIVFFMFSCRNGFEIRLHWDIPMLVECLLNERILNTQLSIREKVFLCFKFLWTTGYMSYGLHFKWDKSIVT